MAEPSASVICARLFVHLHRLNLQGKEDSQEVQDVCAAMESLWNALSEDDQAGLAALSEDLYRLEAQMRKESR